MAANDGFTYVHQSTVFEDSSPFFHSLWKAVELEIKLRLAVVATWNSGTDIDDEPSRRGGSPTTDYDGTSSDGFDGDSGGVFYGDNSIIGHHDNAAGACLA
jgi:hypothetical protein